MREVRFAAPWNVQGNTAIAAFVAAVRRHFDVEAPHAPNMIAPGPRWSLSWLGSRSLLAMPPPASSAEPPLPAFEAAREAIVAAGGALFDVSTTRAGWTISGAPAATVLAKLCPLDFDSRAFPAGGCAQSVLGHMNALYLREATDAFTLHVARSSARDAWHALCIASAQYGYNVLAAAGAASAR